MVGRGRGALGRPACHLDDEWRRDLFVAAYMAAHVHIALAGTQRAATCKRAPQRARSLSNRGSRGPEYTRRGRARIYEQRATRAPRPFGDPTDPEIISRPGLIPVRSALEIRRGGGPVSVGARRPLRDAKAERDAAWMQTSDVNLAASRRARGTLP